MPQKIRQSQNSEQRYSGPPLSSHPHSKASVLAKHLRTGHIHLFRINYLFIYLVYFINIFVLFSESNSETGYITICLMFASKAETNRGIQVPLI